jgi:hypothetical protein
LSFQSALYRLELLLRSQAILTLLSSVSLPFGSGMSLAAGWRLPAKVKFTLQQTMKAQGGRRGTALLLL